MKSKLLIGTRATFLTMALGVVVTSLAATICVAQDNGLGGLEIVEVSGKLEGILGNKLQVVGEDKQSIVILMGDETHFNYSGTATPSVLTPGLLVRFSAAFDQAGTPQSPLAALEIFRPVQGRRLPLEAQRSQTPGVYPIDEPSKDKAKSKDTVAGKKKPNKAPPSTDKTTPGGTGTAAQNYQIVGMIRAVQADRIQIVAGNVPLMLPVDPAVKITVAAADATFCQPGDDVKLNGLKTPLGAIQAETIHVTGAKPLGAIDPKVADRKPRK